MSEQRISTLIIGAGMAGVATAYKLVRTHGHKATRPELLILEGRDRPGGRMYTRFDFGSDGKGIIDCGASWLHTPREEIGRNPLFQVAEELGIGLSDEDGLSGDLDHVYDGVRGEFLPAEFVGHAFEWLLRIVDYVDSNFSDKIKGETGTENKSGAGKSSNPSVADAVHPLVAYWLTLGPDGAPTDPALVPNPAWPERPDPIDLPEGWTWSQYTDSMRRLMRWNLRVMEQIDNAVLSRISAGQWDAITFISDEDRLVPGGYIQYITRMSSFFQDAFEFNKTVTSVEVNPAPVDGYKVIVRTSDGSVYHAQRVVVTVPLGVLKANKIRFEPALPKTKQLAIQRIGYGLLDKVFIEFPKQFWSEDMRVFGYLHDGPLDLPYTMNYGHLSGRPILLFFISCDYAEVAENTPIEKVIDSIMTILRKSFGAENVPDPVSYHMTKWRNDPFALGSYSYVPPDSSLDDLAELFKPIGREIYFAGEATNGDGYGTVHGAYWSGIQAADEIAKGLTQPPAKL